MNIAGNTLSGLINYFFQVQFKLWVIHSPRQLLTLRVESPLSRIEALPGTEERKWKEEDT